MGLAGKWVLTHSLSLSFSLVAANAQTDRVPLSAGDRNRCQIQSPQKGVDEKNNPSKLPRTRRAANVLWKGLRNRAKVLESALDDAYSRGSDIEELCEASDVEKTRAATAVNNILSGVNGHISLWEEIQLIGELIRTYQTCL